MAQFDHREFQDLLMQLNLSPPAVRMRYADRLEEFLLDLAPERIYPYEFLYYRITGFRPEGDRRETYAGSDVLPDLMRVLEAISEGAPQNVDDVDDRVYTLPEVSDICRVAVRTIRRWRRRGLVSRKYIFGDGRTRIGIREAALERFIDRNEEAVEASMRFSKLTKEEEQNILAHIRKLVTEEDLSLTAAANRMAQRFGRSPETVRLLLKRYADEHPEDTVFGRPSRRLGAEVRRRIYQEHRQGTPVEELQQRHRRSRSSIYRVINRERAADAVRSGLKYFYEDAFSAEDALDDILGEPLERVLDESRSEAERALAGAGVAGVVQDGGPLSREQEKVLFRAYNYAKYLLAEAQKSIDPKRYVPARAIRRVESLEVQVRQIREYILYAHVPIIAHAAHQHVTEDWSFEQLAEIGRDCLQEQVESFDYRGRLRFARCVRLELLKRFARVISGGQVPSNADGS